jgi:hypothetical protein
MTKNSGGSAVSNTTDTANSNTAVSADSNSTPGTASAATLAGNKRKEAPDSTAYIAELEAKLEQEKRKTNKLRTFVGKINTSAAQKQVAKQGMKKDVIVEIRKLLKTAIWPKYKFVSSTLQERKLCDMVYELLNYDVKNEAEKDMFFATYTDLILTEMNDMKTYVQRQLMDPCYDSPVESEKLGVMLLKAMTRTLDPNDENDMEFFVWYGDKFLPKSCAKATEYSESYRHYSTISACAPKNDPEKKLMTPSNEAFAVLALENNYKRWTYCRALKRQHETKKLVYCTYKKDGTKGANGTHEVVDGQICIYGEKYRAKFTTMDAG